VQLVSNVDLGEVQAVSLDDLKGLDDVRRALEAKRDPAPGASDLASELMLKRARRAARWPSGHGQGTTIGRASRIGFAAVLPIEAR